MLQNSSDCFTALNQYFDQIYVLTLPHCSDRQKNVEKVLAGLDWQFFWGTDKKQLNLDSEEGNKLYDDMLHRQTKRTHRSMNIGEVACALSHKRIYQDVLEKGYQRVLIMEDDVLPEIEKLAHFGQVAKQLPQDWELLMLGYYGEKRPSLKSKVQQNLYKFFHFLHLFNWHKVSKSWIEDIQLQDYSDDLFTIGKVLGAHAYAISNTSAEKFVRYQTPVRIQADRIFNYYKAEYGLKAFAVKDTMFTLSELSKISSIQTYSNVTQA